MLCRFDSGPGHHLIIQRDAVRSITPLKRRVFYCLMSDVVVFRAMARTILDEVLQVRPDFIEHQLAHAVKDPNGRAYNRTAHLAERKKMMQLWADYLDSLKAEKG